MADFRPGRPGFTMYFDWVNAMRRMAERGSEGQAWALKMFLAIADYAENGTLPEDPFVDVAISGYTHTIESDSEKYWRQVDGSFKGGRNSADSRRNKATDDKTNKAAANKTATADTAAATFGSIFVPTEEGDKPFNVPKQDREAALLFADDIKHGAYPKPITDGNALIAAFADWKKNHR